MSYPALIGALLAALLLPATARAAAFDRALTFPPVLTGSEIEIPIVEADVPILDGAATRMWTYGGTFPGPTIRRPAGAATEVTFVNQLPVAAGDLSVHRHGGHQASSEDGLPTAGLGDGTYSYDLMEGGEPERAAFEWYHDHRLDVTGRNVWNGLAGMFIVDDPVDAALGLPAGKYDLPLMLLDRSFGPENQLEYPVTAPFDGLEGERILVNGLPQPHHVVEPRRYRLRLLNASNSRVLELSLAAGGAAVEVEQIATESGLLPNPVTRSAIELGPADRAEVVVDFAEFEGETAVLRDSRGGDLLEFRVTAEPDVSVPAAGPVPDALRPVPDLGESRRTREFDLGRATVGGRNVWTVGGRAFDPARSDAGPKLDTTETWVFRGGAGVHTVHLHGADFRILSRDGSPPPPWESGLEETFLIGRETVAIQVRFTDHQGPFVFHCHVLEHEDNGMMSRYDVSEHGDPLPTPTPTPTPTPAPVTEEPPAPPPPTETAQPVPASAGLELGWTGVPRRIGPRQRATLRLRARSTGTLATAAGRISVALPRRIAVVGARKRRLSLALPAIAPGTSLTRRLRLTTGRRLPRRAVFTATVGDERATLVLRRRRNALRPAAGQSLLCRLG